MESFPFYLHRGPKKIVMQKYLSLLLLFILFNSTNQAQTTTATLQSVTVYVNGAELNHTAKMNVPSGSSELIIKNISGSVDPNSIQVGTNTDITIMSVTFLREFLSEDTKGTLYTRLQDSLKNANNALEAIRVQIATQKSIMSILDANKVVRGDQTGLNVSELQKMVNYYIDKQKEITMTLQDLSEKETKQVELVTKLQNQFNEQFARKETGKGELRLQVLSSSTQNTTFTISYISNQAAWSPLYDLKAKDTKSPLKIIYRGNIVQNTGLDWNKVKLSLSTNNPNQNGTMPVLSTWFLNYYVPQYASGYDKKQAYRNAGVMNDIQSYGAPAAAKEESLEKTVSNFTQVVDNALNAVFDIDLAYDIPSDNKEHGVAMKEYEVPAQYKYYCVPKLDREAFLVAEVADWESLNLMPGMANIIFDGTYVGKSYIDPNSTQDTLNISLGRDKKLVIKREKVQDLCSSKVISGNRLHSVTYEITVKNTRKESVQLLLKDQLPISTQKDLEVSVLETSEAIRNEETGVLTWKLELAANETRKVRVQYSVKFPKDKVIGNLN